MLKSNVTSSLPRHMLLRLSHLGYAVDRGLTSIFRRRDDFQSDLPAVNAHE